jgi:phosphatidylserine decarboxylase
MTQQERINFLLTNRIPRRYATLFMGWFSKIENPIIRGLSLFVWKLFADDLDLKEAKKEQFTSLHDCFIRELKDGARPVEQDSQIITSPSDGVVGALGAIKDGEVFQAKGFPYSLIDLLHDEELSNKYRNGVYVTLRLRSTMYHRFHAPCDCSVNQVNYISGDTWNVNPIALKRIERLYCKNERAVITLDLGASASITLAPVAAILVASIRLNFLDDVLGLQYQGPNKISCDANFRKGEEMGYFQHGSTIIVFATEDFEIVPHIETGTVVRVGQPLLKYRSS